MVISWRSPAARDTGGLASALRPSVRPGCGRRPAELLEPGGQAGVQGPQAPGSAAAENGRGGWRQPLSNDCGTLKMSFWVLAE